MKILAIDPGSELSAWVLWDGSKLLESGLDSNEGLRSLLWEIESGNGGEDAITLFDKYDMRDAALYIEMIGHYGRGMPAGKTVFDTCVWIGRFIEAWELIAEGNIGTPFIHAGLVLRPTVKTHICGASNAKDANVRQAVWDRFGGRKAAVGTKKQPGPLYGVVKDIMQAFALALYVSDTQEKAA